MLKLTKLVCEVFKNWKTIIIHSLQFPSVLIQNEEILSLHTQAAKKESELALPFRSPRQHTRAVYHDLEARHLDDLNPQTTRKSKG